MKLYEFYTLLGVLAAGKVLRVNNSKPHPWIETQILCVDRQQQAVDSLQTLRT